MISLMNKLFELQKNGAMDKQIVEYLNKYFSQDSSVEEYNKGLY
jgi:predicted DNA-binding protein YlxM (UPF0122 family)